MFYRDYAPAIVTPWVPHGNITEYLEKSPNVNRLRLVSLNTPPSRAEHCFTLHLVVNQLVDVVKGVRYLHSCNIAHGGIEPVGYPTLTKGLIRSSSQFQPNILISDSDPPRAILAGFSLNRVSTASVDMSAEEGGTVSFMAPELLLSEKFGLENEVPSKEADIYALGMTVYQVLTGRYPFHPRRESEVMHLVISGERPPKPENADEIGMTDVVWDLLVECWREDRTKRPDTLEVLGRFPTIEAVGPRLDITRQNNSVVSQRSSVTTLSCE